MNEFRVGADTIVSGREFHALTILCEKRVRRHVLSTRVFVQLLAVSSCFRLNVSLEKTIRRSVDSGSVFVALYRVTFFLGV